MRISGKKDISSAIAKAKDVINRKAEEARAENETSGMILQAVYQHKVEEAYSMASGYKRGAFPLIEAEAEARNVTPQQVASNIISAVHNWRAKMAKIEAWRIKTIAEISASRDTREIGRLADEANFPS